MRRGNPYSRGPRRRVDATTALPSQRGTVRIVFPTIRCVASTGRRCHPFDPGRPRKDVIKEDPE